MSAAPTDDLPRATREVELVLIRHGETAWNSEGRYQGHSDTALSSAGVRAAEDLALALRAVPARRVLSSPLRRAAETAAIVAAPHALAVEQIEDLREMGFGEWEGRTQDEVRGLWPEALRRWKREPQAAQPGDETLAQVQARILGVLFTLADAAGPIVIVSHETPIRTALLAALDLPLSALRTVQVAPGSARIVRLVRRASGCVLQPGARQPAMHTVAA
jgi:broad specificity phosphatase PhoE